MERSYREPSYLEDSKMISYALDEQGKQLKELIKEVQLMKLENTTNLVKFETKLGFVTAGIAIVATVVGNVAVKLMT